MTDPGKKTLWQRLWKLIRRLRFVGWFVVFVALLAVAWLSLVGVPGFIKRPLVEKLRARGLAVEFQNLRLSFSRGLVAYNVRFTGAGETNAPQFTARRMEMPLRMASWCSLDLSGLRVVDGKLTLELPATTNAPARTVLLEKVAGGVRFQSDDNWELENFTTRFGQLNVYASGSLTNAAALRVRKPSASTNAIAARAQALAKVRRVADTLDRLQFTQPADVRLSVSADALDWARTEVIANASLAAALTPWGEFTNVRLTLHNQGGVASGHLETGFAGGQVDASLTFDPATRQAKFVTISDFDLQRVRPFLRPKAAAWISQFTWKKPPQVKLIGSAEVSTNLLDTLQLVGDVTVGPAAFRGVSVSAAQTRVIYTNHIWSLPDLRLKRPEGVLSARHWTDDRTQDYYWKLVGAFDFTALAPLFDEKGQHALSLIALTNGPQLDLELWGRWRDYDRIGATGSITISNFAYRDEPVVSLTTRLLYTNRFVHLFAPKVVRTNGAAWGDGVGVDVDQHIVHLTNAAGAVDLQALGHAIGVQTERVLKPYAFDPPPFGHANGWFAVDNSRRADIHFDVAGTNFHWWNLNAKEIYGNIYWKDQTLVVTNLASEFYTGKLSGWLYFDFSVPEGNFYQFDLQTDGARLGPLLTDTTGKSNTVDGVVTGWLTITNANTDDFMTWGGNGSFKLRNGQLWELPVFGVFAPVLDALYPNMGNGKASEGSASFCITNGVIRTDDAQLSSVMLRMKYRGTVDLEGRLDARAEAALLRETWGVGPLISTVLTPLSKALEYKVTGTVGKPVAEPMYLPKALLVPLHPIQSVKELFSDKPKDAADTNAPAKFTEPPPNSQ